MLTSWLTRFILMLCLSITACTGYAPPRAALGMSKAELMAHMGPAEQERKLDTGSRLEYPRGPFGEQTWFVYLDAAGTVTRTEQVLTTENFDRRTELGDATLRKRGRVAAQKQRFVRFGRRVDEDRAGRREYLREFLPQFLAQLVVEVGQWLVEQDQRRVLNDGASQRRALLLAAGQIERGTVEIG